MYIRWNRRKLIKNGDCLLCAVLVKSVREGNRVRQIVIKYLGSIRQRHMQAVMARMNFWEKAEGQLSALNLEPEVKQSILDNINKKIAKPSSQEIREFNEFLSARRKARLAMTPHHDGI